MAKRGVKKKEFERLDDATVGRVVSLLEQDTPITKKAACETLNISYNTKRLANIIQEYKDRLEFNKRRYDANKGKPFSDLEIKELIIDYLCGESIAKMADTMYRSSHIIKRKIKELNLPERTKSPTYQNPDLIPDEMVSEDFNEKELVWSARYNSVAEVHKKRDNGTYVLWVFGKYNQFADQPWWELGKLEAVKKFNLQTERFVKTEKPNFAYRIE